MTACMLVNKQTPPKHGDRQLDSWKAETSAKDLTERRQMGQILKKETFCTLPCQGNVSNKLV